MSEWSYRVESVHKMLPGLVPADDKPDPSGVPPSFVGTTLSRGLRAPDGLDRQGARVEERLGRLLL